MRLPWGMGEAIRFRRRQRGSFVVQKQVLPDLLGLSAITLAGRQLAVVPSPSGSGQDHQ